MPRSVRRFLAIHLFFFSLPVAAWAQEPAPGAPQPTLSESATETPRVSDDGSLSAHRVAYSIRTVTPGKRFDVRTAKNDQVIARCIGQCTLALPLGSYEVHLYDEKGNPDGDTNFSVSSSGGLEVQDADQSVATIGATLGISGIALMLAGTFLTFSSVCIDDSIHTNDCPRGSSSRAALGVSSIALGAVLTPIGWVLFARNHSARANERPLFLPYAATTSDYRGGIIGLQGSF